MLTHILQAVSRKRDGSGDRGFTLIELLVVVIIIGILAAIAIPVYVGVQNNAKDAAVKSDLTNIKTAIVAAYTQADALPAALTLDTTVGNTTLGALGATDSATYKVPPALTGTTIDDFCVDATSITGNIFHISATTGVESDACS